MITYAAERGPRHRVAGVAFAGNQYFSDELLRGRLQIQPAAFLSRGRYSTALLAADVASLVGVGHGLWSSRGVGGLLLCSGLLESEA